MNETDKPLLKILRKQKSERTPLWLMRQAGRYLPEYRSLRQQASGFIDFCLTPELACEATLQPLRRFDLDAAIVFADILLLPLAMGCEVDFIEGDGPRVETLSTIEDLQKLFFNLEKIAPFFETLKRVGASLDKKKTLIGFSGAPWTLACYMICGQGRTGFAKALEAVKRDDAFLDFLLDKLVNAAKDYILAQIEAGAEVIQIFDSHAGLLEKEDFLRCVIEPTQQLVSLIKEKHPNVPIIGFPRKASLHDLRLYAERCAFDALSIDQETDMDFALFELKGKIVQGNLDPLLLKEGGEAMDKAVLNLAQKLDRKNIFNLGHGVLPQTPVSNVERLVEIVRGFDRS